MHTPRVNKLDTFGKLALQFTYAAVLLPLQAVLCASPFVLKIIFQK